MTGKNCVIGIASTAATVVLTACGAAKIEAWKPVANADSMLAAGDTVIGGFRIRPPRNFSPVPKPQRLPIKTEWVGGGEPPVWFVKSGEEATADTWEDPNQVRVIQGTCPIYMGSNEMVRCETEAVPRQFRISVRKTSYPNSDEHLETLAIHELDSMRQSPDVEDYERTPVEFGTINGVKFARTSWTAKIPVQKRMPSVQMNVPSPAQGYSYATITAGQVVQMTGLTPKGDGWYKAIEQAALTFSPGTHTTR